MSVESLGGREIDWYFRNINEGVEDLSPSPRLFVTQIGLEPVLRKRAEALGVRLEYSTELISFDSDDEGVTAVVKSRDDVAERDVRAALSHRGRRQPQPGTGAARHPAPGARDVLEQHHDLLPGGRPAHCSAIAT